MTLKAAVLAKAEAKSIMKRTAVESLLKLFESNPDDVVAGAYGNKPGDATAYHGAEIPDNKIFIVNTKSDITNEGTKEKTTYEGQAQNEWLNANYPNY